MAPLVVSSEGGLDQPIEMLMLHRGGAWLVVRGNRDSALNYATALAARFGPSSGGAVRWRVTDSSYGTRVHVVAIEATHP